MIQSQKFWTINSDAQKKYNHDLIEVHSNVCVLYMYANDQQMIEENSTRTQLHIFTIIDSKNVCRDKECICVCDWKWTNKRDDQIQIRLRIKYVCICTILAFSTKNLTANRNKCACMPMLMDKEPCAKRG